MELRIVNDGNRGSSFHISSLLLKRAEIVVANLDKLDADGKVLSVMAK